MAPNKGNVPSTHNAWPFIKPYNGNITLGCRLADLDCSGFSMNYYPGDGELIWHLDWSYKTDKMSSAKKFIFGDVQAMGNIGDKKSLVTKQGLVPVTRTLP